MKHKHYNEIIAWAEGKEIEFRISSYDSWVKVASPSWDERNEYRVKQEPKPDVISFIRFKCDEAIEITRDGETGKLKSVRVVES
jgi:hypothetical protein